MFKEIQANLLMKRYAFAILILISVFVTSCKKEEEPVMEEEEIVACYLTSIRFDVIGNPTIDYIYNSDNQLERIENTGQVSRKYTYEDGKLIQIEQILEKDLSSIESLMYNEKGLVVKNELTYSRPPNPGDIPPYFTRTAAYEYNNKNQLIKRTTTYHYPYPGAFTEYTTFEYDQAGNCIKSNSLESTGKIISTQTYSFDDKVNIYKQLHVFPSVYDDFAVWFSTNNVVPPGFRYQYNAQGYISTVIQEGASLTMYEYNCP